MVYRRETARTMSCEPFMTQSLRRCSLALVIALGSTACLRSTTSIELNTDGSGTILQETAVSAQAMGMLQGLAGANATGEKPPQLFGEEQARKTAATMGVKFVSGEPIKTGDLEGYRARFAFDLVLGHDPALGRPAIMLPVFMSVCAGSWLMASPCMPRRMHMSSAHLSPSWGKMVLISSPDLPYFLNGCCGA